MRSLFIHSIWYSKSLYSHLDRVQLTPAGPLSRAGCRPDLVGYSSEEQELGEGWGSCTSAVQAAGAGADKSSDSD